MTQVCFLALEKHYHAKWKHTFKDVFIPHTAMLPSYKPTISYGADLFLPPRLPIYTGTNLQCYLKVPWTQMWTFYKFKKFCKYLDCEGSVSWFIVYVIVSSELGTQQAWMCARRIVDERHRLKYMRKMKSPFSFLPLCLLWNLEWVLLWEQTEQNSDSLHYIQV